MYIVLLVCCKHLNTLYTGVVTGGHVPIVTFTV